jgi:DNA polymerase elongation subunit (family B)
MSRSIAIRNQTLILQRNVLELILSGEATEIVVEQIHEYLRDMGNRVRGGKIKMEDFIINKVTKDQSQSFGNIIE